MHVELTIKNYRCFPDSMPVRITLRDGFTALVGVNNAGKSSLLRLFFDLRQMFNSWFSDADVLRTAMAGNPQTFQLGSPGTDATGLFSNINSRDMQIELAFVEEYASPHGAPSPSKLCVTLVRSASAPGHSIVAWHSRLETREGVVQGTADLSLDSQGLVQHQGKLLVDLAPVWEVGRALASMLYIGPFRNALHVGTQTDYFDIGIGQSFIERWRNWKTGATRRDNEAAYRLTKDVARIFGYSDLEVNASSDNTTLQFFIDGKSYRLAELGAGIAQFFIALANAATRQPSFILIDEPELNLHPSLQLDFLTALASYARHGILFATHSIGLARASADRLYAVRQVARGQSQVTVLEMVPRLSEFLGELSYSNRPELGFDKVLLVEGVTEVKTVQQWLRFYGKEHRIVRLPMGGGQLIKGTTEMDLAEVMPISPNAAALIDSERTCDGELLSADRAAFQALCGRLGIDCCVLDRRAIENYLPDAAVKRVKGEKHRSLAAFERLADVSPRWAKAENWRIAREMAKADLDGTDMGDFLEQL